MTKTQTVVSAQTKVTGSIEAEGDLLVLGHIKGGPLRVAGRLLVGRSGTVSCDEAEVSEALVLGVFSGTLKAHKSVRIHQAGRLLGEVVASRVSFVNDAQLQSLLGSTSPLDEEKLLSNGFAPAKAPASATTPPPLAGNAPPPPAPPPPAPVAMPNAEPPPPPRRNIPPLPSLGVRTMRRRDTQ